MRKVGAMAVGEGECGCFWEGCLRRFFSVNDHLNIYVVLVSRSNFVRRYAFIISCNTSSSNRTLCILKQITNPKSSIDSSTTNKDEAI